MTWNLSSYKEVDRKSGCSLYQEKKLYVLEISRSDLSNHQYACRTGTVGLVGSNLRMTSNVGKELVRLDHLFVAMLPSSDRGSRLENVQSVLLVLTGLEAFVKQFTSQARSSHLSGYKVPSMFKIKVVRDHAIFFVLIIITCFLNEDSCYPKPVFGFSRMFVRSHGLSSI